MIRTNKEAAAFVLMWVLLVLGVLMMTWGSLISHKVGAIGILVIMSSVVWPVLQEFNLLK